MDSYFKHIPLGHPIPKGNPHAVSVSLPALQDVIGYEENRQEVMDALQNGYPRFYKNSFVEKLEQEFRQQHTVTEDSLLIPITSTKAKAILEKIFDTEFPSVEFRETCFLVLPEKSSILGDLRKMIQHTGAIISSRKAEQLLDQQGLIDKRHEEEVHSSDNSETEIKSHLAQAYSTSEENLILTNSGTNAVFVAIETLTSIQKKKGKIMNVQWGNLYLDSMELVRKRSEKYEMYTAVDDKPGFEKWLSDNHRSVANVIAETVSNPLLQCVDLPWLFRLCRQYGIGLIVDHTLATPHCAEVLPYADVVVESLTKFPSGNADVMMGALLLNPESVFYPEAFSALQNYILPADVLDCNRLAVEIQDYEKRMQKISENTEKLYKYLKDLDYIDQIFSVYEKNSWLNFEKIRKNNLHVGLLSIVCKKPFEDCYDRLNFAKGPSLGTEFTLAMPYTYLAHYDLIKTEEGRQQLQKMGLPVNLLRISVGTEPIEMIIEEFDKLKS